MSKINLPQIYTEEVWKRSGNQNHFKYIGLPYVSWSQIESFNDKVGFNTGLEGKFEYIIKYFSKYKFDDMGWGNFGSQAESWITLRNADRSLLDVKTLQDLEAAEKNFKDVEKKVLETIEPLGVFQEEICYYVEELGVIVLGYIDDRTPEKGDKIDLLRDYKTKSLASKKDLHLPKKHQIELYILGFRQQGLFVQNAEYCIIERLGGGECMRGGGRESLYVGTNVWYEPYIWNEERLKVTNKMVVNTVKQISDLYAVYNNYFG